MKSKSVISLLKSHKEELIQRRNCVEADRATLIERLEKNSFALKELSQDLEEIDATLIELGASCE